MDVEKAREQLQDVDSILRANREFMLPTLMRDVHSRVSEALRALDGEGGEEWFAWRPEPTSWMVSDAQPLADNVIAHGLSERDARRIARLPALERAARDAIDSCPPGKTMWDSEVTHTLARIINSFRAELKDED